MNISIKYDEGAFEYEGEIYSKSSFPVELIEKLLGYLPKVIFEFGSQDGGDGLRYKLAYPKAEVYSFEPSPDLYKRVSRIEKYGVNTYNFGFNSYPGKVIFYQARMKDNNTVMGAGSILPITKETQLKYNHLNFDLEPSTIYCTTIEEFCFKNNMGNIDFMQIDVEGAADKVVQGFGYIRPKILFIELSATQDSYYGAAKTENVNKILFDWGYNLINDNGTDSLFILENK